MSDFYPGVCECYVFTCIAINKRATPSPFLNERISTKETLFVAEVLKKTTYNLRQIKPGWVLFLHSTTQHLPEEVKRQIFINLRNYFIDMICSHHWEAGDMLVYPALKFLE
jgi:hypothetical protein